MIINPNYDRDGAERNLLARVKSSIIASYAISAHNWFNNAHIAEVEFYRTFHVICIQRHYIYTYDGACKVLGLEATILAMRPHTPTSSHESCLFGRWARAPNPVASRLETWQSSWHPYSRRAPEISHPFEPKCSRSDRHRLG